jgi:organic radical activating enzyme
MAQEEFQDGGPKAFVECLIPVTACNLRCPYCYVIQENRRTEKIPDLPYDIETIQRALSKKRFGGTCFFNLCGAGETMLPHYTIDIAKALLENGHFINITNNGTISKRFDEIISLFSEEELSRCCFAFSLHYLELKRRKMLDRFFRNVNLVHDAGASILVQLNLTDAYLPYLDEIRETCIKYVGAAPQLAATREETAFPAKKVKLMTSLSEDEYRAAAAPFNSPLFDATMKNFNVKRREFCYNGAWAFELNFGSGRLHRCYYSAYVQDIFKNTEAPITRIPVGNCCNSPYCFNSSHYMALGTVPEVDMPSYVDLRDRPEAGWYQPRMKAFLSHKLSDSNVESSHAEKVFANAFGHMDSLAYNIYASGIRAKRGNEGEQ